MPAAARKRSTAGAASTWRVSPPAYDRLPMVAENQRWERLAALAVHGANVQPRQLTMVSAEHGQAELARACAAAAYAAGAKFVETLYFDTRVKRERLLHADPETLDYVPPWWGQR